MRRRRYWSREWHAGRLGVYAHSHSLNLPRVHVGYEEGGEYLAFDYGTDGSDPVLHLSLDLAGTRVGKAIGDVAWWWIRRRRG